jgi:hypothetical protein
MNNCRICDSLSLSEEGVKKIIEEYISLLDEDECVTRQVYNERLDACSACPGLISSAVCRYCGCFILVRAKRKDKGCPFPGNSRW